MSIPFCPYHFVQFHFARLPYWVILFVPFCPHHFVRYHFALSSNNSLLIHLVPRIHQPHIETFIPLGPSLPFIELVSMNSSPAFHTDSKNLCACIASLPILIFYGSVRYLLVVRREAFLEFYEIVRLPLPVDAQE